MDMDNLSNIPLRLKEIPEPPKRLYVRGVMPAEDEFIFLSVIGSRKATPYGRDACDTIISGLAGYPFVIVSGLALGMDQCAHECALKYNLRTIAVPGSGISDSVIYPRTNAKLAKRIIDAGGALLSEFEPNFEATTWSFPRRNRIMAGLSHGVLVIEAEEASGSRITARLGMDYNRDVFAVPGSIFSNMSQGTNLLVKEGATPVTSAMDILKAYNFDTPITSDNSPMIESLSPEERMIYTLLLQPRSRDDIIRSAGLATYEINILLSALEMKGIIKETMGEFRRM